MTTPEALLPEGFKELEPFINKWALTDIQSRWDVRSEAEMSDINRFYDAMLPRTEEALALIQPLDLERLEPPFARLYQLVLALVHAAMAVELHRAPRAKYSPYPHSIRIIKGPAPFA